MRCKIKYHPRVSHKSLRQTQMETTIYISLSSQVVSYFNEAKTISSRRKRRPEGKGGGRQAALLVCVQQTNIQKQEKDPQTSHTKVINVYAGWCKKGQKGGG
eukprot:Platyproteum_vivax@DN16515_c0_g1_i1.p1